MEKKRDEDSIFESTWKLFVLLLSGIMFVVVLFAGTKYAMSVGSEIYRMQQEQQEAGAVAGPVK